MPTINSWNVTQTQEWASTSLQGYVTGKYSELVRVLGQPCMSSDTRWPLRLQHATTGETVIVTIYDYDTAPGACKRGEYEWHIGGFNRRAFEVLKDILRNGFTDWQEV